MKAPKVICEAAVLAEALLDPEGDCALLLRRFVEERSYELVLSPSILEELDHLLADGEVRRHLEERPAASLRRFSASLGFLATAVEGVAEVPAGEYRLEDEKVLAAALEVGGGVVVSTDETLLSTAIEGLEVVSPRTLVEVLDAV